MKKVISLLLFALAAGCNDESPLSPALGRDLGSIVQCEPPIPGRAETARKTADFQVFDSCLAIKHGLRSSHYGTLTQ